jgi:hypothetical protein
VLFSHLVYHLDIKFCQTWSLKLLCASNTKHYTLMFNNLQPTVLHLNFPTPFRKLPVLTFHIWCLHIYSFLITNHYTKRKIYSEEIKFIFGFNNRTKIFPLTNSAKCAAVSLPLNHILYTLLTSSSSSHTQCFVARDTLHCQQTQVCSVQ